MQEEHNSHKYTLKLSLLGQTLVKKSMITSEQLEEALLIQKNKKIMLGEILIQLGYITYELLAAAVASQSELIYIPIEKYKISKELLKLIPKELAHKYSCLPLEKMGDVLTVVMLNPTDSNAVEEISRASLCKILCMVGAKDQLEVAVTENYNG